MRNVGIVKTCGACRAYFKIEVEPDDLKKWETGAYTCKSCFPYLEDNEVCLLLNNMCDECYAVRIGENPIF